MNDIEWIKRHRWKKTRMKEANDNIKKTNDIKQKKLKNDSYFVNDTM